MARTCPVDGCAAIPHPGVLMCRHHWRMVSPAIRADVLERWRTMRYDPDLAVRSEALAGYRLARQASVEEVNAKESRRARGRGGGPLA